MLIYNIKREFVGITEETLRRVGYNSASELQEDAVDFADLFENKPGFLHNFKNFSWLDFILHSEQDNIKSRIRCNGKIYECSFKIENYFFLSSGENEPGFVIELTDLNIIGDDDGSRPREVYEPEAPQALQMPDLMQAQTKEEDLSVQESTPDPVIPSASMEPISMPELMDDSEAYEPEVDDSFANLDFDMSSDDKPAEQPIEVAIPIVEEPIAISKPKPSTQETAPAKVEGLALETPKDYVYDPSIAADELGLPSDLIDEFVGDFIVQAKKFRPDLESAITSQDFDNIQILSHKLKGVAANLRIENALEVLTLINSSKDISQLNDYLAHLYYIVHQLEFGKGNLSTNEGLSSPEVKDSDDLTIAPLNKFDDEQLTPTDDEDLYAFDLLTTQHDRDEDSDDHDEVSTASEVLEEDRVEIPQEESHSSSNPLDHIDTKKFDIHEASSNLDIPMETLKSYVDDFVSQANALKSELESALTSKNLKEVKELATQLIGVSDALNMNYASQLLSTLQTTDDVSQAIQSAKELFIFIREL